MTKTDLDNPSATPQAQARTPWESIDPPESAPELSDEVFFPSPGRTGEGESLVGPRGEKEPSPQPSPGVPGEGVRSASAKTAPAGSSTEIAARATNPPTDFEPIHTEIPHGATNESSPFASTAITAGAEMADLASEIQALVDSHQFNEAQEIITAPAESPEEQVVTQAFLSDTSDMGIGPMAGTKEELASPVGSALADAGALSMEDASTETGRSALHDSAGGIPLDDEPFSSPPCEASSSARATSTSEENAPQAGPLNGARVENAFTDAPFSTTEFDPSSAPNASAKADPTGTQSLRFAPSSIEPPIAPATIDATPWATMDDENVGATVSPPVMAFIDIPAESPLLDRLADLDLSDEDLDALDSSDIHELSRGDLAMNRPIEPGDSDGAQESAAQTQPDFAETVVIPKPSTDDSAVTFAMTDPVAASIPQMGIVSEPAPAQEERAGDATVLVPDFVADIEAEHAVTASQHLPKVETEPQWVLEPELAPSPVTTGGAWTIPLMCLGIGLIACCIAIPQIDFNRRLHYDQHSLAANLQAVQKQVAVNDEFLKKVMDDPTLAERLAGRQMKTIRKGQKVIPLEQVSDESDMSPFALMAVAPPPQAPPYKPIRGTIANLCYNARSRLYLLGTAMTMVAVGLVMGYGTQSRQETL